METSRLEEDKNIEEYIIKASRNLFRLNNQKTQMMLQKKYKKPFQTTKENKAIKDKIIRDIRNLLSMKKKIIINQ